MATAALFDTLALVLQVALANSAHRAPTRQPPYQLTPYRTHRAVTARLLHTGLLTLAASWPPQELPELEGLESTRVLPPWGEGGGVLQLVDGGSSGSGGGSGGGLLTTLGSVEAAALQPSYTVADGGRQLIDMLSKSFARSRLLRLPKDAGEMRFGISHHSEDQEYDAALLVSGLVQCGGPGELTVSMVMVGIDQ